MIETVSHNGLDTEVYDLRPADYTTTTIITTTTTVRSTVSTVARAVYRTDGDASENLVYHSQLRRSRRTEENRTEINLYAAINLTRK